MKKYLLKDLWVEKHDNDNNYTIGYRNGILLQASSIYNLFEDKLLAAKSEDLVYVFAISNADKNLKFNLIRINSKNSSYEVIRVMHDEYLYYVDFNCKITCGGRK